MNSNNKSQQQELLKKARAIARAQAAAAERPRDATGHFMPMEKSTKPQSPQFSLENRQMFPASKIVQGQFYDVVIPTEVPVRFSWRYLGGLFFILLGIVFTILFIIYIIRNEDEDDVNAGSSGTRN